MVGQVHETACVMCKKPHVEEHIGDQLCQDCRYSVVSFKSRSAVKEEFFGNTPAPFIGRYGYPHVNVGILSPGTVEENVWTYDSPRHWTREDYSIRQIATLRSGLINSRTKADVHSTTKVTEIAQEVSMAKKPVELEVGLAKKPHFRLTWDQHSAPMGPAAQLKNIEITSNPSIPDKVEKVFSDTDLRAAEGVSYLYKAGFEPYNLSRMLSVGTMGLGKNRKLVPTRWSITATDDIIGKQLITKVKDFPEADYMAFVGEYFGNNYIIMLFPEVWSYELFETYASTGKQDQVWTDHEFYGGRKQYAFDTAGGYYAARLSVLEKLVAMKRQAAVLALRFVTDEYSMPLGVWVVREAAKKTMQSTPIRFSSAKLMLTYAETFARKKFSYDASPFIRQSHLLKHILQQKKISDF